jgi:hypothetical protein
MKSYEFINASLKKVLHSVSSERLLEDQPRRGRHNRLKNNCSVRDGMAHPLT